MKRNRRIIYFSCVTLIMLVMIIPAFLLNLSLPPLGDGAAIALEVNTLISGGEIKYINGPMFFIYTSAVFNSITGKYLFLPTIFGLMICLAVFLLSFKLTKSLLGAILISLSALSLPYTILYSSTFFMETSVVFFIILTLYTNFKLIEDDTTQWLILTGLFLGVSVSLKQTAYILPIIITLQNLLVSSSKKLRYKIKNSIKLIFISMIIILPFIAQFFYLTGTIFEPNNPLLTTTPVNKFAQNYLSNEINFEQIHLGSHFSQLLPEKFLSTYNPSLYYYYNFHLSKIIFLTLVVMGCVVLYRTKRREFVYLSIFLIIYHLSLVFIRVQRYMFQSKILILIILISPIVFYSHKKSRFYKYLAISMIIVHLVLFVPLYLEGIKFAESRENTMCWNPSGEAPIYNLIEAYDWIKQNSLEEIIIADPCRNEAVYYADRDTYWLSPFKDPSLYIALRNSEKNEVIKTAQNQNIKYIIIMENMLSKNGKLNTPQFLPISTNLFIKENFKEVFHKEGVYVYEFY